MRTFQAMMMVEMMAIMGGDPDDGEPQWDYDPDNYYTKEEVDALLWQTRMEVMDTVFGNIGEVLQPTMEQIGRRMQNLEAEITMMKGTLAQLILPVQHGHPQPAVVPHCPPQPAVEALAATQQWLAAAKATGVQTMVPGGGNQPVQQPNVFEIN